MINAKHDSRRHNNRSTWNLANLVHKFACGESTVKLKVIGYAWKAQAESEWDTKWLKDNSKIARLQPIKH